MTVTAAGNPLFILHSALLYWLKTPVGSLTDKLSSISLLYPTVKIAHCSLCCPAGLELSTAALEACLAESNSSVQQVQAHCDSLQAQLNLMEAGHAADMEAMTQQLAEAAGAVAGKEAAIR